MSNLAKKLQEMDSTLFAAFEKCTQEATSILQRIIVRFPDYTDHSIKHTDTLIEYCGYLISDISNLTKDELYILLVSCILHDIGMTVNDDQLEKYCNSTGVVFSKEFSDEQKQEIIRNNHHIFSALYIMDEWVALAMPSERYAHAVSLVAKGHRKVEFEKEHEYNEVTSVKDGNEVVRIVYLSTILRIADEFDISKERTPELYCKYFFPTHTTSKEEFNKHLSTQQINWETIGNSIVTIKFLCTDINLYNSLLYMLNKIKNQLDYCQKVLGKKRLPALAIKYIEHNIKTTGFEPLPIKFSVDNEQIFKTLIGKNLYKDKLVAVRECIQNCIDACRYMLQTTSETHYIPKIVINLINGQLSIEDNGIGMSEYIIENYFSKLGRSFYVHDVSGNKCFKSIGQFGIGVASYFLICDEFEVLTNNNGQLLKFNVTNNFDQYFIFSEKEKGKSYGTKIVFSVLESVTEEISIGNIKRFVERTFRFCEIPIYYDNELLSQEQMGDASIAKTFSDTFINYYKNNLSFFKTHNIHLNDDTIEASCGFVFNQDNSPVDVLNYPINQNQNMREWFKDVNDGYKKINLYNNGVFIKIINGIGALQNIVGDINIKQGIELKLDRSDLGVNSQLDKVLNGLSNTLARELSKIINHHHSDINFIHKYEFILYLYLHRINAKAMEKFHNSICKLFNFFKYNTDNKISRVEIEEIKKNDEFIIFKTDNPTKILYLDIFNNKNITQFYFVALEPTLRLYMFYLFTLGFNATFYEDEEKKLVHFFKGELKFMPSNEPVLTFNNSNVIFTYIDREHIWNINNEFVNFVINYSSNKIFDDEVYKIIMTKINNFFLYNAKFFAVGKGNYKLNITEINEQMNDFNKKYKKDFFVNKSWFPYYLQEYLED